MNDNEEMSKEQLVEDMIEEFSEGLKSESESETKKMWRPKVITPDLVQKMKACFAVWMNTRETLYFSWIKKSSFYNYLKEHSDFLEEIDHLKNSVTLQSKINIGNSIKKGSVADSWKWLEKRDKAFADKTEVSVTDYTYSTNLHDNE